MIFRVKIMQNRKETALKFLKGSLFSLLFFLISLKSYTQDSLSVAADFTEEKELKFQQFFFTCIVSEVYWELSKGNRKSREL